MTYFVNIMSKALDIFLFCLLYNKQLFNFIQYFVKLDCLM